MSSLKRWHEEEASPDELKLLAASRAEEPDPDAYRKTLALALGATTATAATTAVAGRWLATGTTKILVALSVVGAVGVGVVLSRHAPSSKPAVVTQPLIVATPATIAAPETPVDTSAAAISIEALPHAVSVEPKVAAPPAPQSPPLLRELKALERAKNALSAGDLTSATRELDDYTRAFPNGEMAPEATVLRVRVLLAQGRAEDARSLAHTFAAAHPSSPYTARMLALVGETKK